MKELVGELLSKDSKKLSLEVEPVEVEVEKVEIHNEICRQTGHRVLKRKTTNAMSS